jgi:hypothetical protein
MKPPEIDHSVAAVQQPVLQGHQWVAGLWFPAAWFDEAERARRLIAHWQHGDTALRFAEGDLLRHAAPSEQWCETLGGWPLRQHGRSLSSAPLSAAEAAALPHADVWLVQGGQVSALQFSQAQALDPAHWLAIDGLTLHDTCDCRAALPQATVLIPQDPRDLREVLNGRVPPASDDQREFLRALAAGKRPGRGAPSPAPGQRGASPSDGVHWRGLAIVIVVLVVAGALLSSRDGTPGGPGSFNPIPLLVLAWLAWLLVKTRGADSPTAARPVQPAAGLPARGNATVKQQAWRRWLSRLAITSQVSRLLGRRQAAYMRKMMALFESGQLDEALRHAIPLGSGQDSLGQAFGSPGARQDLSLSRTRGASTSIHLGDDLDAYLRRLYRQSFEKLDREGRIDEAVFVLAELLEAHQEALDYLEKHGRHQQAAELALAWDQPADVIVRLQCLAGHWRQAVAVARRDNAFATAVLQLEKRWPEAAARLRAEWAQALATQGDWLGAVEAIWPLTAQRTLAVDWLLAAEAAGGQLGARALVKRAVLLPETLADCAVQLKALRDNPACHLERGAMAEALLALKERHPRVTQLANLIAPALLADQGSGRGLLTQNEAARLAALARNAWLDADLPSGGLRGAAIQDLTTRPEALQGQLPDPGALPVLDAVALDDGQHLVALGESGAAVVDAHGKLVARYAVPAQRIVIARSRQVALALALRDRVWRVSRIDLAQRRTTDLGVAELGHITTEFDGIAWTVAGGSRLRVLDTQHSLHEVLWQVTDLPGQVRALSVNSNVEQLVLVGDRGEPELWRYNLPQRRLVARGEAVPERVSDTSLMLLNPNGGVVEVWTQADAGGALSLAYRLHGKTFSVAWAHLQALPAAQLSASISGGWLVAGVADPALTHWLVIALGTGRLHACVAWPTEAQPRARVTQGRHIVVSDLQGRLWSVDSITGRMKSVSVR